MGQLVVLNHLSLDGVMQAPGRPDEDTRGGFEYGGWAASKTDEVMGSVLGERMARAGAGLLFGRRTYEDLLSHWNEHHDDTFTAALNNATKFVASSSLLQGDIPSTVAQLKEQSAGDLGIMGSGVDPFAAPSRPYRRVPPDDPPGRAGLGSQALPGTWLVPSPPPGR